jgi:hypothetical protein
LRLKPCSWTQFCIRQFERSHFFGLRDRAQLLLCQQPLDRRAEIDPIAARQHIRVDVDAMELMVAGEYVRIAFGVGLNFEAYASRAAEP